MPFGLAILGVDHWYTALGVADGAAKSDICPLVGIAETDATRHEYLKQKYPNTRITVDPSELLSRDDVSLVAICAATKYAPGLAIQALGAGKHVVSVKPPAPTLAELDEVIAVAESSGKFYGSFEGMQRLTPRVTLLRDLIAGGAIGLPMSMHQVGHGGLPKPWPDASNGSDSWWLHRELVPGGAWIDHAIYAIDLARFVFGGEITFATGIVENRIHTELSLEDYGMALLRLSPAAGGPSVALMLEDTWTAQPGGGRHRNEIIGSTGYLRPDGNDWVVTSGGQETRHPIPEAPFFRFDALAELLQNGNPIPFTAADARANLAACLEVYEAAK